MQTGSGINVNLVINFTMLLVAVVIMIFVLFYAFNKKLRRQQKEAISSILLGQQNERARIARDLHDGMVPDMASIISTIEEIDINDLKIIEIKERAKLKLIEAIEAIRQVSHDLMPETLNKRGLIYALREMLGKESDKGVRIYFTDNTYELSIEPEIAFHLYKITQEVLHNSFKHSGASQIDIAIFYEKAKNQLLYTFSDNGKGFASFKLSDGIGLKNIKTRAVLMHGLLSIDGNKGFNLSIAIRV